MPPDTQDTPLGLLKLKFSSVRNSLSEVISKKVELKKEGERLEQIIHAKWEKMKAYAEAIAALEAYESLD